MNGDTFSPTVTPTAAPGNYTYTMMFDHMSGSTSDQMVVEVRDYSFAFGNGGVDIDDLLELAADWPTLVNPDHDTYPTLGDGQLDIRDMIALTQCNSYNP